MGSTESKAKILAEKAIAILNTVDEKLSLPNAIIEEPHAIKEPAEQSILRVPFIQTMADHKKYRSRFYDIRDGDYANKLANMYYITHNQETKEKFNEFSEYLLDEPAINRKSLLEAINDYHETTLGKKYPLSLFFTSAAVNFQNYQYR